MILEEMYNGRFYPCETVVADSQEYRQAVKACAASPFVLFYILWKDAHSAVM